MDGMLTMDFIGTGLKTLAMLFVVLGLLVLILYGMKRMSIARRGSEGDIRIDVLSSLYLSPKERIAVVEVTGERIVLGITPGNIRFLTRIDNGGDVNESQ